MRETELKSVVHDLPAARAAVEAAGGRLAFEGELIDTRFDLPDARLGGADQVLRLRVFRRGGVPVRASLDWKGPTSVDAGYKVREELSAPLNDAELLGEIIGRLGFQVTERIEREIAQYELSGATVRFERYPRMDILVEVEGTPDEIERAIAASGLPRAGFSTDRLHAFAQRYAARTGEQPAFVRREIHDRSSSDSNG